MKRMMLLSLLLALGLALPAAAESLTSTEMARLLGSGINLGNTLEACDATRGSFSTDPLAYERLWGQPETTADMLRGMRAAGFRAVRIPVAWMTNGTRLSDGDGIAVISEAWMDRVQAVVDMALDAGLYVILNDHWDGGWYGMFGSESEETRALAMSAYRSMWRQIALRFRDYDERLILEGANEELGARFDEDSALYCHDSTVTLLSADERYALTNAVNQAFVDTVRASGGSNSDRFLLIPGYGTDIAMTCDSRFTMPQDTASDRLLLSVHYYTPWSYCGAADAAGAAPWGTAADYRAMRDDLSRLSRFTESGVGIVIGEYGALPGPDNILKDNTIAYHTAFLNLCGGYGYACCLWDTGSYYDKHQAVLRDDDLAALYAGLTDGFSDPAACLTAFSTDMEAAPERFGTGNADDTVCMAWIMWSGGGWALTYSVGDSYRPDSASPGILAQDAVITGPGTYTVSLDFTGTAAGCSSGAEFAAIGISRGETQYPGYVIDIVSCSINGQPAQLNGLPYTASDDGQCTRVNLYNVWISAVPGNARMARGDILQATAMPLDLTAQICPRIESIAVTFTYGPAE